MHVDSTLKDQLRTYHRLTCHLWVLGAGQMPCSGSLRAASDLPQARVRARGMVPHCRGTCAPSSAVQLGYLVRQRRGSAGAWGKVGETLERRVNKRHNNAHGTRD